MEDNIVSLQDAREARQPHISGPYMCLSCKHKFVAVVPVGLLWVDCPECGLEHARPQGNIQKHDAVHWHCDCGNDLFYVTPEGSYCPICGKDQDFV